MGEVVSATCSCGFTKKEMPLGSGLMEYTPFCNFPHFCSKCKLFFEANLYDDICCPECSSKNVVAYDNKKAYKQLGKRSEFVWAHKGSDLILTNGKYYCPSCNKFELVFSSWGNWD